MNQPRLAGRVEQYGRCAPQRIVGREDALRVVHEAVAPERIGEHGRPQSERVERQGVGRIDEPVRGVERRDGTGRWLQHGRPQSERIERQGVGHVDEPVRGVERRDDSGRSNDATERIDGQPLSRTEEERVGAQGECAASAGERVGLFDQPSADDRPRAAAALRGGRLHGGEKRDEQQQKRQKPVAACVRDAVAERLHPGRGGCRRRSRSRPFGPLGGRSAVGGAERSGSERGGLRFLRRGRPQRLCGDRRSARAGNACRQGRSLRRGVRDAAALFHAGVNCVK